MLQRVGISVVKSCHKLSQVVTSGHLQRHVPVDRCARVEVDAVLSESDVVGIVVDYVYDDNGW